MEYLKRSLWSISGSPPSVTPCVVSLNSCIDCSHQKVPNSLLKTIDQADKLSTTLKPYSRHFLISTGRNSSQTWPEKISSTKGLLNDILGVFEQKTDSRSIVTLIDKDENKNDWFPSKVPRANFESWKQFEVLVLPENIREIVTSKKQAEDLFNATLKPLELTQAIQAKSLILVCAHKKRDNRCGKMAQFLLAEFETVVRAKGLQDQVVVFGCSHVGGHKYAGNVIIYPSGDWYGRVLPCHVEFLLDEAVGKQSIVKELWRGRMNTGNQPSFDW